MSRNRRSLPPDDWPVYATDSYTGDTTANPVFRYGQWWDGFMYAHHRRDLARDQERVRRNRLIRSFVEGQSASADL